MVEIILNTAKYTKADVKYWMKERKRILKEILNDQLRYFSK